MPINFFKEGGVSKIQFASGQIAVLLGRVSILVDNSVNQLIIAEDGKDKYWISTSSDLQVEGEAISGTNQQKANLIASVFAAASASATGNLPPAPDGSVWHIVGVTNFGQLITEKNE